MPSVSNEYFIAVHTHYSILVCTVCMVHTESVVYCAVLLKELPERFELVQVSFHKYGDNFFPGTGACGDVGYAKGAGYSVNVPLRDGMDDESYEFIFEPVMKKVLDVRCPSLLPAFASVVLKDLHRFLHAFVKFLDA